MLRVINENYHIEFIMSYSKKGRVFYFIIHSQKQRVSYKINKLYLAYFLFKYLE
jgi:hypothetical protein